MQSQFFLLKIVNKNHKKTATDAGTPIAVGNSTHKITIESIVTVLKKKVK